MRLPLLVLFSLGLSSCFVVTDLDRFKKVEALAPSNFSNLRVTVRGMTSHVNEKFEYRVVDGQNVIQSRGFIIPLGGPDATFFVPNAVPKQNPPFRFDFYADHDNSGGYDLRPDTTLDHAWRLPLNEAILDDTGTYVVSFDHNTSFTNLNTPTPPTEFGKDAVIHLQGMEPFIGKRVEVRVSDASTSRTVAMQRVPVLQAGNQDLTIPGMIEPGVTYAVEVYTDDGKGGGVRAFQSQRLATDTGLDAVFEGNAPGPEIQNPPAP